MLELKYISFKYNNHKQIIKSMYLLNEWEQLIFG